MHKNADPQDLPPLHPEPAKIGWLEEARGAACLMVVLLHASADYLYRFTALPLGDWLVANVVDAFVRASVPLFFMISGYLFFQDRPPVGRHFAKLFACLGFYSALAIGYRSLFRGELDQALPLLLKAPIFPPFYHLWYFYSLVGIYAIATCIRMRPISAWTLIGIAVLLLALNPTIGTLRIAITYSDTPSLISPVFLDGTSISFVLYALAGAVLGTTPRRVSPWLLWSIYVACSLSIASFTYLASLERGVFVHRYYEYTNVLVAGAAGSIFLIFRFRGRDPTAWLRYIASNSVAVYGVHALVLDWFSRQVPMPYSPLLSIPATSSLVLVLSLILATGLRLVDRRRLVT